MMKSIKLLIVIVILSTTIQAQAWLSPVSPVGPCGGGVIPVCSEATDYIGSKSTYSTATTFSAGYILLERVTAVCASGAVTCNLATANIYHNNTTQSEVVLCVYNDTSDLADTTNPKSTDTLVGQSNEINLGTSTGNKSAVASGTYTITNGGHYWLGMFVSATGLAQTRETNTTAVFYKNLSASGYPSCPATIPASMTRSAGHAPFEAHFTLGP